jgi:hypothetical protein
MTPQPAQGCAWSLVAAAFLWIVVLLIAAVVAARLLP